MVIRPAPAALKPFLKAAEGSENRAYKDTRGTWTIGVGHTGQDVHPDLHWTNAQIDAQLDIDIAVAIESLQRVLKAEVIASLTDSQYAALISFMFNMGAKSFTKNTDLAKALNGQKKGWEDEVVTQLMRWVHETDAVTGEKRVVVGLINRRGAEATMFKSTGAAVPAMRLAEAAPLAPSSGSLRVEDTPPTPQSTTPQHKRPSFIAQIFGGVLATPVMINSALNGVLTSWVRPVMEAIAPFADRSAVVGTWVGYLAMAAAAIVAASFALQAWERHREKTR